MLDAPMVSRLFALPSAPRPRASWAAFNGDDVVGALVQVPKVPRPAHAAPRISSTAVARTFPRVVSTPLMTPPWVRLLGADRPRRPAAERFAGEPAHKADKLCTI